LRETGGKAVGLFLEGRALSVFGPMTELKRVVPSFLAIVAKLINGG
jgi:hypothetical protein